MASTMAGTHFPLPDAVVATTTITTTTAPPPATHLSNLGRTLISKFQPAPHNIGPVGNSDTRAGLDGNAKQAIMRIMDERQISFDDAD